MTNELRDPKLHVEQIKNNCKINQLKQEVKNTKSLNSECILNKKATELAETNVRYVFDFQQYLNCIYIHISLYPQTLKTMAFLFFFLRCTYRGCPYKFATEEIMQQHVAFHTESQSVSVFKCSICRDLKFTKWRQCSLHLWKKHEIG